jgi:hypothetical protein
MLNGGKTMIAKQTKPLTTTWMGRKGTVTEYRTAHKVDSLRLVRFDWADGEVEHKLIEGDGRTDDFKTYWHYSKRDA